jgi:heterodisulfide reductase subunit D
VERTEEALATLDGNAAALENLYGVESGNAGATPSPRQDQRGIIAVSCPFCMTMMSDGVKNKERESSVQVFDIAELIATAEGLNA